jgi:membrane-associated protease RseP (regulator of RpoE activity)
VDPRKAFHSKSILARFLIVFAAPAMNFVLAAVIFARVHDHGPARAATRHRPGGADAPPPRWESPPATRSRPWTAAP